MKTCEICQKECETVFQIYSNICPQIEYKTCRKCMEQEKIPYWGLIGLLIGEEIGLIPVLTQEEKIIIQNQLKDSQISDKQLQKDIECGKNEWNSFINNNKTQEE